MNTDLPDDLLALLVAETRKEFQSQFGYEASFAVAAPGRVNLIGEHIDYNDGFALPLAIERYTVIAVGQQTKTLAAEDGLQRRATIYSKNFQQSTTIRLDEPILPAETSHSNGNPWPNYVAGVLAGFARLGEPIPSFDATINSNLPIGGGLSSSAALEVATATALEQICERTVEPIKKALLCQRAEHEFAGVPCGIMDQFSSVFGSAGNAMLIDCRSQEIKSVPFRDSNVSVLITNSNVQHQLTGTEYAERRAECNAALKIFGATSWRDVTMEFVEQHRKQMSDELFRRSRHVVTEIDRTVLAAEALEQNDLRRVGELMVASHDSLRDDFQVSCRELDLLVEIASEIGEPGGVLGSRMTGGGFGGCTVSLVNDEQLESVCAALKQKYESKTGIKPDCFSTRPSRGAHVIK